MIRRISAVLFLVLVAPVAALAQEPTEERLRELEEQVRKQQEQIDSLQERTEEQDQRLDLIRQQNEVRRDIAGDPALREGDTWLEISGFVNFDLIYDFKRVDPTWESTLRPTTIGTVPGEYGTDGKTIFSVKQTRLGLSGGAPTSLGPASWWIEFDLFGLGNNAGATAISLRNAWGEIGPIGFGWTWSNFIDIDIWPNILDWWGPSAMALNRNPQVRYTLEFESSKLAVALENSNASLTTGVYGDLSPGFADSVQAVGKLPDLTAHYRRAWSWGHLQIAGALRQLSYERVGVADNEPKGSELGWGLNLTGVIGTFGSDNLRFGVVAGEGIGSFVNDGGVNLAPAVGGGALAVPTVGVTLYYDHYWPDYLSSAIGASRYNNDSSPLQSADEVDSVWYGSTNLLWAPGENFWMGLEFQYGHREDIDGSDGSDYRLQFQFRYTFSERLF